jgi:hypothetical protein
VALFAFLAHDILLGEVFRDYIQKGFKGIYLERRWIERWIENYSIALFVIIFICQDINNMMAIVEKKSRIGEGSGKMNF